MGTIYHRRSWPSQGHLCAGELSYDSPYTCRRRSFVSRFCKFNAPLVEIPGVSSKFIFDQPRTVHSRWRYDADTMAFLVQCHHGMRSLQAANWLKSQVHNVKSCNYFHQASALKIHTQPICLAVTVRMVIVFKGHVYFDCRALQGCTILAVEFMRTPSKWMTVFPSIDVLPLST